MTTIYPRATWREVTDERTDPPIIPVGVILHVSGGEAKSLFGYFDGPSSGIESHLHIAREPVEAGGGGIEQYRDLENEADANYQGNSWISGGKRYGYLSVETQGTASGPWGTYQFEEIAQFLAWASKRFGFPLTLCRNPKDPGVGYHVMWGAPGAWTPARGKVCPGPGRIAQVPAVLARARVIAADQPAPPEPPPAEDDEDMGYSETTLIPPAPGRDSTTGLIPDEFRDLNGRPLNLTPISTVQPDGSDGIKVGEVWVSLYAVVPGSSAPFNVWAERSGGDQKPVQVWSVDGAPAWVRSYPLRARSSARLPAGTHGLAIAHDCPSAVSVLVQYGPPKTG